LEANINNKKIAHGSNRELYLKIRIIYLPILP